MDCLTFAAEIVKACAWPLIVFAIFIALRRPLIELIPLLRKLKFKELELEFEQKIVEVRRDAAQVFPTPAVKASTPSPQKPTVSRLTQLAERFPRVAIDEAWIAVEKAAANAISRRIPEGNIAWNENSEMLSTHNILNAQQLRIYNELRQLRNDSTHNEFRIRAELAADYIRLAEQLISLLERND